MHVTRRARMATFQPRSILSGILASLALPAAGPALAQDTEPDPDSDVAALDQIVVTARRREENLMEVPLAVTALTDEALAARNITNMMEVSHFTPGLHFTDEQVSPSSGRNDRANYNLVFRGNSLHSGTLFVDGAPVASNTPPPYADIARIEILKGPQAVYFGRSTYTGAINFVTRDPSQHEFRGRVTAEVGSFGSNKGSLSLEGPIVDGLVAARLTAFHEFKGGHYRNETTGGRLGERKSDGAALSLLFTASDRLKIKNWASFVVDDDGPIAAASLRGAAGEVPDMLNCDLGGTRGRWYCGTLPDWDEIPRILISVNDDITPFLYQQLIENPLGFYAAHHPDFLTHAGFKRHTFQNQLRADYETDAGYTISFLGAYHWDKEQWIQDSVMVDGRLVPNPNYGTIPGVLPYQSWLFNGMTDAWDYSLEARVTSPQEQRLRWTFGASFLESSSEFTNYAQKPTGTAGASNPNRGNPATSAVFGGIYYDVTEDLTLAAEARYQEDHIRNYQIGSFDGFAFPGGPVRFSGKFNHVAPRVSLDYKLTDDTMVYVLFSRGFRPGGFNSSLINASQFVLDQIRAASGVGLTFDEEQLDNYEIGVKSTFLNGRARAALTLYYDELRKGQTTQTVPIITDAGASTIATLTANIGAIDFKGLEFEGELQATAALKLGATVNLVDSEVKNFYCSDCMSIYRSPDATGHELQQTVKTKFTVYADYTAQLNANYNWYLRGDYNYRGKYWITTANLARVPAQNLMGLRLGLEGDTHSIEAYVTNLLYDKGLRGSPGLDTLAPSGLLPNEVRVQLPDKRTFGIKASYNF